MWHTVGTAKPIAWVWWRTTSRGSGTSSWRRPPGSAGGYIVTADPDVLYRRVLEHQADVVIPLADTAFGSREFAVRDPEGNLWSFGSYRGETRPENRAQ